MNFDEERIDVGVWREQGANGTRKIAFRGRSIAQAITFRGHTSTGDDRGTDWRIYQTEKGKYILWWLDWSRYQGEPDIADYIILDNLPSPGTILCGTVFGDPIYPVPGELIQDAAEMLGRDTVEHLDV